MSPRFPVHVSAVKKSEQGHVAAGAAWARGVPGGGAGPRLWGEGATVFPTVTHGPARRGDVQGGEGPLALPGLRGSRTPALGDCPRLFPLDQNTLKKREKNLELNSAVAHQRPSAVSTRH